jgi:hypothetical protein
MTGVAACALEEDCVLPELVRQLNYFEVSHGADSAKGEGGASIQ